MKNEREGKIEQGSVYSIYWSRAGLQWMQGNYKRELSPNF